MGSLSMEQTPTGRATNSALGGTLKLELQQRGAPLHGAVGGRQGPARPWHGAAAATEDVSSRRAASRAARGSSSPQPAWSRSLILPPEHPTTLCPTHGTAVEHSPVLAGPRAKRLGRVTLLGFKVQQEGLLLRLPSEGTDLTSPHPPMIPFLIPPPSRSEAASSFASCTSGED